VVTAAPASSNHYIFGKVSDGGTCRSDQALHNALCETFLADQLARGLGSSSPLIPVVYSAGTPGTTVSSACGCLWEKFLPDSGKPEAGQYLVDPASFGTCDKRPICDTTTGNSITDCATVMPNIGDYCQIDDPNSNCCSGYVTVAPSADFSTSPLGGSCVTEFNIGGTTMIYRWETDTSPCPDGWTTAE